MMEMKELIWSKRDGDGVCVWGGSLVSYFRVAFTFK